MDTPSEAARVMPSEDDVITAKVAEITEHRAVIEQARGMLMLVYGALAAD